MKQSYKELKVWRKSIELVESIYLLTQSFPSEEMYGLTSQMRRAAISIPSNSAEGQYRTGRKGCRQFLVMAYGSGAELETQLEIAKRLSYGRESAYSKVEGLVSEVMRMLNEMVSLLTTND